MVITMDEAERRRILDEARATLDGLADFTPSKRSAHEPDALERWTRLRSRSEPDPTTRLRAIEGEIEFLRDNLHWAVEQTGRVIEIIGEELANHDTAFAEQSDKLKALELKIDALTHEQTKQRAVDDDEVVLP
jgi:hypothetical protein